MYGKGFFASKTNIFNILTAIVTVFMALLNVEWVAANPQLTMWIGTAVGFINIVLRTFFTEKPITSLT